MLQMKPRSPYLVFNFSTVKAGIPIHSQLVCIVLSTNVLLFYYLYSF